MEQDKHFHSKSYKWGYKGLGLKQVQNPAGQTLIPVVPCPASEVICGTLWAPKGLAWLYPNALLVVVALIASLFRPALLPPCSLDDPCSWLFQMSGVSTAHTYNFTHCLASQNFFPYQGLNSQPGACQAGVCVSELNPQPPPKTPASLYT